MRFYLQLTINYILRMLPGFLAASALYAALLPWRRRRLARLGLKSGALRESGMVLLWLFCGGMAVLTLMPEWFDWIALLKYGKNPRDVWFALGDVNLIPFQTLELGHQTRYTVFVFLGNIIMFLPFGFLAALLWRGFTAKKALWLGAAVTGLIEVSQLFIGRAFDIDDLLLNAFGVVCGFWLWQLLSKKFPRFFRRFYCRRATLQTKRELS